MKVFKIILVPLVLAYFSILLGYVVLQRKLIFHPVTIHDLTPKNYDLSYQNVSFPSYDGVTLTGWWMQHPKSTAPRPVLLYCHGNADDLSMLAEVSRLFYDFGFDELLFDYRSYGASEKAPKGLSEKALDGDALAAYQWVKAKGFQDKQMMIWGHSLGSSVAAWLATQTHPAGLILEGAFPSLVAVSHDRYPWLLILPFMLFDKFETSRYVTERTCPLLEIHAEKDTIIPIGLGKRVFQAADEPKQWIMINDINHNDFPSVARQYQKPIQDFVKTCLSHR